MNDLYLQIGRYFAALPRAGQWATPQALFERAAAAQPDHWQLPALACQAAGGSSEQAIPAVTAAACLHLSILLIDDLLDNDPRGEQHRLGVPGVANLAAAFQAAGLEAILHSRWPSPAKLSALACLNRAAHATACGQAWDSQNPADECSYWQLVRLKSAPFFGALFYVGALAGAAPLRTAQRLERLGRLYGEMIQIHDDLNDSLETPANPDWMMGRSPLPILFAQAVAHPESTVFLALREKVNTPQNLAAAQAILLRCGAVSYCLEQIIRRYRAACRSLKQASLPQPGRLQDALDGLIHPVEALLAATDRETS